MDLSQTLEPIASIFRNMNLPEPITHWGHPFFMSIVMFLMGGYGAYTGWKGRLVSATDPDTAIKLKADHQKTITAATIFMAMGYTGGLLSLVIQKQPVLESPHFWTGSLLLLLLFLNGGMATTGFNKKPELRKVHAYFGSVILGIMIIHALLGLKLGLSI
jgi:hypothetical protein